MQNFLKILLHSWNYNNFISLDYKIRHSYFNIYPKQYLLYSRPSISHLDIEAKSYCILYPTLDFSYWVEILFHSLDDFERNLRLSIPLSGYFYLLQSFYLSHERALSEDTNVRILSRITLGHILIRKKIIEGCHLKDIIPFKLQHQYDYY